MNEKKTTISVVVFFFYIPFWIGGRIHVQITLGSHRNQLIRRFVLIVCGLGKKILSIYGLVESAGSAPAALSAGEGVLFPSSVGAAV